MNEFNNWFAWYPVAYGPHISWLKTIQRRYDSKQKAWFYRRIPSPALVVPRIYKQKG